MEICIPIFVGLLVILIDTFLIKFMRAKIESNFIIKFIITWSFVAGIFCWIGGIVFIIWKL